MRKVLCYTISGLLINILGIGADVALTVPQVPPKNDCCAGIKDPQVKRILEKQFGEGSVDNIRELRIDNMQICTVEGFVIFRNLKHLSLAGNFITNLVPLTQLSNLKTLDLSRNQIVVPSGINLWEQLESLDLSHNQLKYAFCCLFVSLRYLKLNNNHIQQLIFINDFNKLLEEVDISDNPIKDIRIKAPLLSLKRLIANRIFITQLSGLEYFSALEELHLKHNPHLSSIAPLFYPVGDHWECRLKQLKKLYISEEFLDNKSKTILHDIKNQKNSKLSIQ